ncbi:hypothetical protein chiPu_0025668, partial [Chiloscyllium punctatum]|nr:hypothetical protein [Chiloscyllium punctatum]
ESFVDVNLGSLFFLMSPSALHPATANMAPESRDAMVLRLPRLGSHLPIHQTVLVGLAMEEAKDAHVGKGNRRGV